MSSKCTLFERFLMWCVLFLRDSLNSGSRCRRASQSVSKCFAMRFCNTLPHAFVSWHLGRLSGIACYIISTKLTLNQATRVERVGMGCLLRLRKSHQSLKRHLAYWEHTMHINVVPFSETSIKVHRRNLAAIFRNCWLEDRSLCFMCFMLFQQKALIYKLRRQNDGSFVILVLLWRRKQEIQK